MYNLTVKPGRKVVLNCKVTRTDVHHGCQARTLFCLFKLFLTRPDLQNYCQARTEVFIKLKDTKPDVQHDWQARKKDHLHL